MRDLERQRTGLYERLAAIAGLGKIASLDPKRIEVDPNERLADWRRLLRRHVSETRQILRKLIVGRLAFTPREGADARWYEFTGLGILGNVVSGLAPSKAVVAPTGDAASSRGYL
jgi:hypothetical protein